MPDITQLSPGLYFGAMLVMLIYNAFIFATVQDISYLFYVFYISTWTLLLRNFAILPDNFVTRWGSQLGSAMEVVFLALGLADAVFLFIQVLVFGL